MNTKFNFFQLCVWVKLMEYHSFIFAPWIEYHLYVAVYILFVKLSIIDIDFLY